MPWSPAQHRLFEGIAHGDIKPKGDLSKAKAANMASEGIKKDPNRGKKLAAALRSR